MIEINLFFEYYHQSSWITSNLFFEYYHQCRGQWFNAGIKSPVL